MIAVDSSALIAILENEPEAEDFLSAIRDAPHRLVSAVSVYETGIVIGRRRGRSAAAEIMPLLDELGIEIAAFHEPYITRALEAYARFGKGIDPRARLNLGDCASYALASVLGVPLLFKGSDFTHTDVLRVS